IKPSCKDTIAIRVLGKYFEIENIRHLKYLSIWIIGLWLSIKIYLSIFYYLVKSNIEYNGITIADQVQEHNYLLIIALFIWVLSHIFKKGIELEDTQKYTV
ncbi:hypothetical protein ACFL6I_11865, partial [candidate division KSB1 bacterium]